MQGYHAIPPVLLKQGKVKNPYPNVDAHSGQLMSLGRFVLSRFAKSFGCQDLLGGQKIHKNPPANQRGHGKCSFL